MSVEPDQSPQKWPIGGPRTAEWVIPA